MLSESGWAMDNFIPGYIPSPPDERDYSLDKAMSYQALPLFSGRVWTAPVINQGAFGCCVAAALSSIVQAAEFKQRNLAIPMSVKYIYGNRASNDIQSEGMMPREALQMLSRFGVPREVLLPGLSNYPDAKASITNVLEGEGIPNRIRGYVRLKSLQDISDYLSLLGLPVLFCTQLTESFMTTGSNGVIPSPSGAVVGGHAMQCVGIQNGSFILQNSWGTEWGDKGFGYLNESDNFNIEAWGVIPEGIDTLINRPQVIMLTIGSTTMMVDVTPVILDSPPVIINQRTMVPLRAISEALKVKVDFYGQPNGRHIIVLRSGGEQDTIGG